MRRTSTWSLSPPSLTTVNSCRVFADCRLYDQRRCAHRKGRTDAMANADPYELLGVAKDATQQDIQKAFRRLAKQYHPDLNPGDKDAHSKFQEISAAYDILGDEKKRARFDSGEIDASGNEQPQRRYYRDFAQAGRVSALRKRRRFCRFRRRRRHSLRLLFARRRAANPPARR